MTVFTQLDIQRLGQLVRARIGWPISAGAAATIVTVVLQELSADGRLTDGTAATATHLVVFADDGTWSVEHPTACRERDMAFPFDCPVHHLAVEHLPERAELRGRYQCWPDPAGDSLRIGVPANQIATKPKPPADRSWLNTTPWEAQP